VRGGAEQQLLKSSKGRMIGFLNGPDVGRKEKGTSSMWVGQLRTLLEDASEKGTARATKTFSPKDLFALERHYVYCSS
jgi:hypothetical protein